MTSIENHVKVPNRACRDAGLLNPVYLTRELEDFFRDPGPGDDDYFSAVLHRDGTLETVGCVGESYGDRVYDAIWMARCALFQTNGRCPRQLTYSLRINGLRVWLAVTWHKDAIVLGFPGATPKETAA